MCTQLATHPHPVNPPPRALVIGGSLGGLFAGNLLRRIGWHVDLYERSAHDLDSRGGGIVLQPDVVEVFRRTGVDLGAMDLGVGSVHRAVLRPDGSIRSRHFAPQTQTSWSLIYTTLRAAFGDAHYHQAKTLARIEQNPPAGTVTAHFTDGSSETADLLIGADGGNSAAIRRCAGNCGRTKCRPMPGISLGADSSPKRRCRRPPARCCMAISASPTTGARISSATWCPASTMTCARAIGCTTGSGTGLPTRACWARS
ncbi:hypothetical protein HI802_21710 (plasmid) [Ralstonia solanacearum]|nr:FAD-dependent monooxygenase [Ralstonia pseudosolanacearum]MCK4130284.1 hypothetical protein [Ralstonia pseudosolanacearum]QKL94700.1 hypothetical protein HI802_21710 [Ralstonia solanacearum]QKL99779.1 hypothetical protein HI801_21720 [Ralstonia solanacearum]QLR11020.1 FAD-dependent monooxygenase [Ralstonia solanacearum]